MMAAADRITIEITGPRRPRRARLPDGGRGAGGGHIITAVQSIVSRNVRPSTAP
jgi:hypothetical protein